MPRAGVAPPPVSHPLSSTRQWRVWSVAVQAVAAWTLGLWVASHWLRPPGAQFWLSGVMLIGVLALCRARRRGAGGAAEPGARRVTWTGAEWCVQQPPSEGEPHGSRLALEAPEAVVDLGGWLLLRLRPVSTTSSLSTFWAVASCSAAPASWRGLRMALGAAPAGSELRAGATS